MYGICKKAVKKRNWIFLCWEGREYLTSTDFIVCPANLVKFDFTLIIIKCLSFSFIRLHPIHSHDLIYQYKGQKDSKILMLSLVM